MKLGLYFGRHAGGGGGIAVYAQALLRESLRQIANGSFPSSELHVYADEVVFSSDFKESLKGEGLLLTQNSESQWQISSDTQRVIIHTLWNSAGRKLGLLADQLFVPRALFRDDVKTLHSVANLGLIRFIGQQLVTVHDLFQAYPPRPDEPADATNTNIDRAKGMHGLTLLFNRAKSKLNKTFYRTLFAAQFKRKSDYFICDLESVVAEIANRYAVPADRVMSVALGIDSAIVAASLLSRNEARKIVEQSSNFVQELPPRFALLIASADPRKNSVRQVTAWDQVQSLQQIGSLSLVVLCQDPAIEAVVRRMAPMNSLIVSHVDRTVFAGLLRAADILLFATRQEGFGLPVLEALSCRTTVLASSDEAVRHYPLAKENVFLCDPTSVDSIVSSLQVAIAHSFQSLPANQNRSVANELGNRSDTPVRTMQEAVQETIDLYRVALSGRSPVATRRSGVSIERDFPVFKEVARE